MSESIRRKPKLADNGFQFVFDKKSKTTRALIGLPPSLCYAAWVVTIVPMKLRGCRRRRIRVRRRNGAETAGAEMCQRREVPAPKRWRRDGGAETAAPKCPALPRPPAVSWNSLYSVGAARLACLQLMPITADHTGLL